MKGKISERVENLLRDQDGQKQLRDSVINGRSNVITLNDTAYRVKSGTAAGGAAARRRDGHGAAGGGAKE